MYEEIEKNAHAFKTYVKQTMDLLSDAYKWKIMSEECDTEEMKNKYMSVSNALYGMFTVEYNNLEAMFKGE